MKQPKLNNTLRRQKAVSSSFLASKRARARTHPTSSNLMLRSRQDAIKDIDKQRWHWIEEESRRVGEREEEVEKEEEEKEKEEKEEKAKKTLHVVCLCLCVTE